MTETQQATVGVAPSVPSTPPVPGDDAHAQALLCDLLRAGFISAGDRVALGSREAVVAADGSLGDAGTSGRHWASPAEWARESDAQWHTATTASGRTLASLLSDVSLEDSGSTPRRKAPDSPRADEAALSEGPRTPGGGKRPAGSSGDASGGEQPPTKRLATDAAVATASADQRHRARPHRHSSAALAAAGAAAKRIVRPTSQDEFVRYDAPGGAGWRPVLSQEQGDRRDWEARAPVLFGGREYARAYCKTYDTLYYDQAFFIEILGRIPSVSSYIRQYITYPMMLKIVRTDRRNEVSDYSTLRRLGVLKSSRAVNLATLEGLTSLVRKLEASHRAAHHALVATHDIHTRLNYLRWLEDRRADRSPFGAPSPHSVVVFPQTRGADPHVRERETPRNSSGSEADEPESARASGVDEDQREFMYKCECGKSFKTSQGKAGHCHFCPRHQALSSKTHTPAPPEDIAAPSDSDTTDDEQLAPADQGPASPSAAQMLVEPMTPTSTPAKPEKMPPSISIGAPEGDLPAAPPAAPALLIVSEAKGNSGGTGSGSSNAIMPPPQRLGVLIPHPRALEDAIMMEETAAQSAFSAPASVSPSPSMEIQLSMMDDAATAAVAAVVPTATVGGVPSLPGSSGGASSGATYECSCGRVFSSSQAKAGHCHYCKTHRSLHNNPVQGPPLPLTYLVQEKDKKIKQRGRKFLVTPTGTPNPETSGPPTPPSRSQSPMSGSGVTSNGPPTPHSKPAHAHTPQMQQQSTTHSHYATSPQQPVPYTDPAAIVSSLQAAVTEAEQAYAHILQDRDALNAKISDFGSLLSGIRELVSQVPRQQQQQPPQPQPQQQQSQPQQQGQQDAVASAAATACARASRVPGSLGSRSLLSQMPSSALFAAAFQSTLKMPATSAVAAAAAAVAALSAPSPQTTVPKVEQQPQQQQMPVSMSMPIPIAAIPSLSQHLMPPPPQVQQTQAPIQTQAQSQQQAQEPIVPVLPPVPAGDPPAVPVV